MSLRHLPPVQGYASADAKGRLFAPSAARNLDPLGDLLAEIAPTSGTALELAAGTGQHSVAFAARLPGLTWTPSDVDPARRASVAAYRSEAGLPNLAEPVAIDATESGWGTEHHVQSLVLLSNLLHLISTPEARTLIREAATALAPGGLFVIYGPFMRAGELTSEGDRSFHARLVEADPEVGYKDDFDVIDWLQCAGLELEHAIEMPANNLVLAARK